MDSSESPKSAASANLPWQTILFLYLHFQLKNDGLDINPNSNFAYVLRFCSMCTDLRAYSVRQVFTDKSLSHVLVGDDWGRSLLFTLFT